MGRLDLIRSFTKGPTLLLALGMLWLVSSARGQERLGSRFADTESLTAGTATVPNQSQGRGVFPAKRSSENETSTTSDASVTTDVTGGEPDEALVDASEGISGGGIVTVIRRAGLMAIPILVCSFLLVMFGFERIIALRRNRVVPKHFVKRFLEELDEGQLKAEEALDLCEQNRSPVAEVFAAGIKRWGRPSVEVEQAVLDAGERVANNLRRYLRLFNGISTICPLFGLLGTVLGMISAFNTIAASDAMGRPEMLASGIGQALLTTAGGLSVAIPAFIAYIYFTGRVDRLCIEIDQLAQEVVASIASDSWKSSKPKRKLKTPTEKAA